MSTFRVRSTVETVATDRATGTAVAQRDAEKRLAERLWAAGDDLAAVETEATGVYEFPTAPFEPYRITVRADLAVAVEAEDGEAAIGAGRRRIEDLLAAADLDGWSYVEEPALAD